MRKTILSLIGALFCFTAEAQVSDNFNDNDFTTNPTWTGDISEFNDTLGQLGSSGSGTTNLIHLSTPSNIATNATWEFFVNPKLGTSAFNYMDIFLMSDSANLEGMNSGYFVRIGGTSDEVSLYLKQGATSTEIIDGADALIASASNNPTRIRVTRTSANDWTLEADYGNTGAYTVHGTVNNGTVITSEYFGVLIRYTSSNATKYFFDDLVITTTTADTFPPEPVSAKATSDTTLDILFNEPVDEASAEKTTSYNIYTGPGTPASAILDAGNPSLVHLEFNTPFTIGTDSIAVSAISDVNGNISTSDTISFNFSIPSIVSANALSPTTLEVDFSEPVVEASAENPTNYTVNKGIGQPLSAVRSNTDSSIVILTFSTPFVSDTLYTVTALNIKGHQGGTITTGSSATFVFTSPFRKVVINEIFPDPTPSVGLPAFEFFEIFNRTNQVIDLTGWKVRIGTVDRTLTSGTISPNGFAILTSAAAAPSYSSFGNTIIVPGASSTSFLLNTAGFIQISDNAGQIIDSISYSDSFYQDAAKQDGGWTMEQINPDLEGNCPTINNWRASVNPQGGTPGSQNSIYSTTADTTGPAITSASGSGQSVTVCLSESVNSSIWTNPLNYNISGIGSPVSVTAAGTSCFNLSLSSSLSAGTTYTLTLTGFRDCSGNIIADSTITFSFVIASRYDVVINEIMADPDPVVNLPNAEYIELHNTTSSAINLFNWTITVGTSTRPLPNVTIKPDSFLVLTTTTGAGLFSGIDVVGVTSFPSLTNSGATVTLRDTSGNLISTVTYDDAWYQDSSKVNGGWSLEQIDPENPCGGINNWRASVDADGGTPGRKNSVNAANPDVTAPSLLSAILISPTEISLLFNEPTDSLSAATLSNYSINSATISISSVAVTGPSFQAATLILSQPIIPNVLYTITASSISDCAGNTNTASSVQIADYTAKMFDVVINELMPDPDPSINLPNYEYVEIYNRSSFPINLNGWTFTSGTTTKVIPSYTLQPNAYLTLSSTTGASALSAFGPSLGISSFPSLLNTSGTLTIRDDAGNLIHTITYSTAWYKDATKEEGGWSLEQIDPNNPCGEAANWRASIDPDGGTPGTQNSVFGNNPDVTAPAIASVEIVSGNMIKINFTETIDSIQANNINNYSVDNGIGQPLSVTTSSNTKSATLTLATPLSEGVLYHVSVTAGITDCAGNATTASLNAEFALYTAKPFDLVINEIMPDPDPAVGLPAVEYIEIHNTTNFPISLANYSIASGTTDGIITTGAISANGYAVLTGTTGATLLASFPNVIGVSGFPSLTNSGSQLILRNPSGQIVSFVEYNDSWYKDPVKQEGGWSLEQIDPNNPCGGEDNWAASKDPSGGTPGRANSVKDVNTDTEAPRLIRAAAVDSFTVQLFFSENLDSVSLAWVSRYSIAPSLGSITSVRPTGPEFNSVMVSFNGAIATGQIYTISVSDSIQDCAGNRLTANTARFGLAEKALMNDLVINEILFNPKTDGVDFVEVYNRSAKIIDLYDLRIAGQDLITGLTEDVAAISTTHFIVFPGEYYVFTEDPDAVKKQYFTSAPDNFVEVEDMPAMGTSEGGIKIIDEDSILIDVVVYSDDWHLPILEDTKGVSLERLDPERPSSDPSNWHSAAETVGYATPGYKNSQASDPVSTGDAVNVEPQLFSPDNDGHHDVVNINYHFDTPGLVGNIMIFDQKGRLIRHLVNNELIGLDGTFSWNGINDAGEKAAIGIYVILFEVYDIKGLTAGYKKVCVLGGNL